MEVAGVRLPPDHPSPGPDLRALGLQVQDLAGWTVALIIAVPTIVVLLLYRVLAILLLFLQ